MLVATTIISKKCKINILSGTSIFYILPALKEFDGIIGYDLLREIKANIDCNKGILHYQDGQENLKYFCCSQTNKITIDGDSVPSNIREKFN